MGRLLVNVILDRSGSMATLAPSVIENYNDYINELKNLDQEVLVSLIQFDDQYEEVYSFLPVSDVGTLTNNVYFARGLTALNDAVGRTIKAVDAHKRKGDKVIIVINTDGFENHSREFTGDAIKELIISSQKKNDYQFIFIGAGIDAFKSGAQVGLRSNQTLSTSSTPTGISYGYANLTNETIGFASGSTLTMDTVNSSTILGTEDEWAKNNTIDYKKKVKRQTTNATA